MVNGKWRKRMVEIFGLNHFRFPLSKYFDSSFLPIIYAAVRTVAIGEAFCVSKGWRWARRFGAVLTIATPARMIAAEINTRQLRGSRNIAQPSITASKWLI